MVIRSALIGSFGGGKRGRGELIEMEKETVIWPICKTAQMDSSVARIVSGYDLNNYDLIVNYSFSQCLNEFVGWHNAGFHIYWILKCFVQIGSTLVVVW